MGYVLTVERTIYLVTCHLNNFFSFLKHNIVTIGIPGKPGVAMRIASIYNKKERQFILKIFNKYVVYKLN